MGTSAASVWSEKSTNVRSAPWSLRALRLGFRVLGPTAPSLAGRVAEQLFLTARRHPRPAWEHELLERARKVYVPYDVGFLPTWSWGNGPAVLLVHGWEGRGAQLGAFVNPLVEAGFRVVTFDGPGHGDASTQRASLPDMADAITRVAAALGPIHAIVAHSMAAAATTLALTRLLRVQRAVFLAPATDARVFARSFANAFGLSDGVRHRLVRRIERRFDVRLEDLYVPELARRMTVPLRVIHDANDKEVGVNSGRALVAAWPGATLTETSGLGHHRILRAPAVVAETLHFLRGHDAPMAHIANPSPATDAEVLGLEGLLR